LYVIGARRLISSSFSSMAISCRCCIAFISFFHWASTSLCASSAHDNFMRSATAVSINWEAFKFTRRPVSAAQNAPGARQMGQQSHWLSSFPPPLSFSCRRHPRQIECGQTKDMIGMFCSPQRGQTRGSKSMLSNTDTL